MKWDFCKPDPQLKSQLKVVQNAIPIGFQSVFCITHNATHNDIYQPAQCAEFCLVDGGVLHRNLAALLFGRWDDGFPFLMLQRYLMLMPTALPQQPMQIGWWRLDTQIRSDHLQITVWTVCLKDLIWETNLICLQSEQSPTRPSSWLRRKGAFLMTKRCFRWTLNLTFLTKSTRTEIFESWKDYNLTNQWVNTVKGLFLFTWASMNILKTCSNKD